ncbi:efflux RND transporter periplasmic adaptor subunit [Oryzifoliimicrobium ureilyticus]|uniref:efflux RND transporter periplasmic adaptor subunit n=1 Tax=Oryzifoliimicrobium ureilyticus TaxID=3113724 RepID=UPI00307611FF
MKKLPVLLIVIAAAAAGVWYYRADIPYVSAWLPKAAGDTKGETVKADAGSEQNGSQKGGKKRGGGPAAVKTVAAKTATLPMDVPATGWAEAEDTTTLAAQQQGIVNEIAVKDGVNVKAGDLIIKLDDRTAKAAVEKDKAAIVRDQATLDQAETALKRAGDLLSSQAGTQQSFDQAKAARDTAAATVDADKAALSADMVLLGNTEIRAPYDGRLSAISVSVGDVVSAGTALTTLVKYDPIYVRFRLPEAYLQQLKKQVASQGGLVVDAAKESTGGVADSGKVTFYDNAVDTASGTILVKAEFDNADAKLWPGQSVNVIVRFTPDDKNIVVPTVAVTPGANGSIVYVVQDGKVHLTPVTVARTNGDMTAIAKGLSEGARVVVEGRSQLVDGQTVADQGDSDNKQTPVADNQSMTTGAVAE